MPSSAELREHGKVIVYFPEQQKDIDLTNGRRIRISRTRSEGVFIAFAQPDSAASTFVRKVSDDDILRLLFFLKHSVETTFDSEFPANMTFPLSLDPAFDLQRDLKERSDYQGRLRELEDAQKEQMEIVSNLTNTVLANSLKVIASDDRVLTTFKRSRKDEDLLEAFRESLLSHKDELSDTLSAFPRIMESMDKFRILNSIKSFIGVSEMANYNASMLSHGIHLPADQEILQDALYRLARAGVGRLSTESICLDCWFRSGTEPFSSTIKNVEKISLDTNCRKCDGMGMIHSLMVACPRGLHMVMLPESSWLQEIIVGYTLSRIRNVKETYVHKKISPFVEGNVKEGVATDVSCITADGRLIIAEVTAQSSLDKIVPECERKVKNLDTLGIPYDHFFYITSNNTERNYPIRDNATILMGRHVFKLYDFVTSLAKLEN